MKRNPFENPKRLLMVSSVLYFMIFVVFIYFLTSYHPPIFKQFDIEIVNIKIVDKDYYEGDINFEYQSLIIKKLNRVKIFQNNKQFFINVSNEGKKIKFKRGNIKIISNKNKINAIIFIESRSKESLLKSIVNKKI